MTLADVPINGEAKILHINGNAKKRLLNYGLHVGDTLRVLRQAPLGGPLLVGVDAREIALGRDIAENIIVEVR